MVSKILENTITGNGSMKIEKLFFVSLHKMLTDTIELLGKKNGLDVFTINDFDEAYHFIKDLNPSIIVADNDGVEEEVFSKFMSEFSSQIPVVVIGNGEKAKFLKPIDPIKLLDELELIYNS
ncbi:MAG: hypothetical protein BM556_04610 [Bacteriovorax sp. MedPE-SWde]|nr:MAG: hypothetical protein BM556_04610 [Bacteriovorax sp. MedPE-SWde]